MMKWWRWMDYWTGGTEAGILPPAWWSWRWGRGGVNVKGYQRDERVWRDTQKSHKWPTVPRQQHLHRRLPPLHYPATEPLLRPGGGWVLRVRVYMCRSVHVLHHREGLLFSTRQSQVLPSSAFILLWIQLGRSRSQNTNVHLTLNMSFRICVNYRLKQCVSEF